MIYGQLHYMYTCTCSYWYQLCSCIRLSVCPWFTKEESFEYTCITPLHYGIAVEFTPLYLYSFLKGGGGGNDVHGTINEPHLP